MQERCVIELDRMNGEEKDSDTYTEMKGGIVVYKDVNCLVIVTN